jgi:hypothetical protein
VFTDIAVELTKMAFNLIGCGIVSDEPLDDDLGARRHLEVDGPTALQLGRLAALAPHHVPLADADGYGRVGEE